MSDTIRDGIIVTVVGTLLASLLLWLFGSLKPVWRFLRGLPPHVWRFLRKSVARQKDAPVVTEAPRSNQAVPPISVDPQLDQLQARIMNFFAEADGGRFNVVEMSYKVTVPKLKIEAALDGLTKHGLVAPNRNYVDGTTYGLSMV